LQIACLDGTGTILTAIGAWLSRKGLAGLLAGRVAVNLAGNNISDSHGVGFNLAEMEERPGLLLLLHSAFQISGKLLVCR